MSIATLTNKASSANALLMRFEPTDTASKVSRATLASLAKHLGYKRESEVLHYAVRKLADEILPTYEPDDGLPSPKQMAAIRKAAGPASGGKVVSSLF